MAAPRKALSLRQLLPLAVASAVLAGCLVWTCTKRAHSVPQRRSAEVVDHGPRPWPGGATSSSSTTNTNSTPGEQQAAAPTPHHEPIWTGPGKVAVWKLVEGIHLPSVVFGVVIMLAGMQLMWPHLAQCPNCKGRMHVCTHHMQTTEQPTATGPTEKLLAGSPGGAAVGGGGSAAGRKRPDPAHGPGGASPVSKQRRQDSSGPAPAVLPVPADSITSTQQPAASPGVQSSAGTGDAHPSVKACLDSRLQHSCIIVAPYLKGCGGTADVFVGKVLLLDGTEAMAPVAVKVYFGPRQKPYPVDTLTALSPADTELNVLHDIRLRGKRQERFVALLAEGHVVYQGAQYTAAVLEMCQRSLEEAMEASSGKGFFKAKIQRFLVQVLEVVAELRARNLVHRDVKPANFLVAADGSLKLGDFTSASRSSRMHMPLGTPFYMAPEAFMIHAHLHQQQQRSNNSLSTAAATTTAMMPQPCPSVLASVAKCVRASAGQLLGLGTGAAAADAISRGFDHKVDVWGAGIVLLQLCAGNFPAMVGEPPPQEEPGSIKHQAALLQEVKLLVSNCPASALPERWRNKEALLAARDFLRCCCCENPAERWEAQQLLQHEWLGPMAQPAGQAAEC